MVSERIFKDLDLKLSIKCKQIVFLIADKVSRPRLRLFKAYLAALYHVFDQIEQHLINNTIESSMDGVDDSHNADISGEQTLT